MNNPLVAQMMSAQGPSDEEMLDQVHRGMGNQDGPPPGSGMKWEDLNEDQQALLADPSPVNVQAFVQYWGEENLPEGIQGRGPQPAAPAEGEY